MSDRPSPSYDELLREFNALQSQIELLKRKAADTKEEMDIVKPMGKARYEIWCRMDGSEFWTMWGATHLAEAAHERLVVLRQENPGTEYEIRESTR